MDDATESISLDDALAKRQQPSSLVGSSIEAGLIVETDPTMNEQFSSIAELERFVQSTVAAVSALMAEELGLRLTIVGINTYSSWATCPFNNAVVDIDGSHRLVSDLYTQSPPEARRSAVTYLTNLPQVKGGVAWGSGACNHFVYGARSGSDMSVCGSVKPSDRPLVPRASASHWAAYVIAHEVGHSFGGKHTHEFYERGASETKADGSVVTQMTEAPIDRCATTLKQVSGCSNPPCGTIMSYCHMVRLENQDASTRGSNWDPMDNILWTFGNSPYGDRPWRQLSHVRGIIAKKFEEAPECFGGYGGSSGGGNVLPPAPIVPPTAPPPPVFNPIPPPPPNLAPAVMLNGRSYWEDANGIFHVGTGPHDNRWGGATLIGQVGANCGNGRCQGELDETCHLCPRDCGECWSKPIGQKRLYCGDDMCHPAAGEDCRSCPSDCGTWCVDARRAFEVEPECGNGRCEDGEDAVICPDDCADLRPFPIDPSQIDQSTPLTPIALNNIVVTGAIVHCTLFETGRTIPFSVRLANPDWTPFTSKPANLKIAWTSRTTMQENSPSRISWGGVQWHPESSSLVGDITPLEAGVTRVTLLVSADVYGKEGEYNWLPVWSSVLTVTEDTEDGVECAPCGSSSCGDGLVCSAESGNVCLPTEVAERIGDSATDQLTRTSYARGGGNFVGVRADTVDGDEAGMSTVVIVAIAAAAVCVCCIGLLALAMVAGVLSRRSSRAAPAPSVARYGSKSSAPSRSRSRSNMRRDSTRRTSRYA
jgi:hypothetical protein